MTVIEVSLHSDDSDLLAKWNEHLGEPKPRSAEGLRHLLDLATRNGIMDPYSVGKRTPVGRTNYVKITIRNSTVLQAIDRWAGGNRRKYAASVRGVLRIYGQAPMAMPFPPTRSSVVGGVMWHVSKSRGPREDGTRPTPGWRWYWYTETLKGRTHTWGSGDKPDQRSLGQDPTEDTVGWLICQYLEAVRAQVEAGEKRPSTYKLYTRSMGHVPSWLRDKTLEDVTPEDVVAVTPPSTRLLLLRAWRALRKTENGIVGPPLMGKAESTPTRKRSVLAAKPRRVSPSAPCDPHTPPRLKIAQGPHDASIISRQSVALSQPTLDLANTLAARWGLSPATVVALSLRSAAKNGLQIDLSPTDS